MLDIASWTHIYIIVIIAIPRICYMESFGLLNSITARDIVICGLGFLAGRLFLFRRDRYLESSSDQDSKASSQSSRTSSFDSDSDYDAPTVPIRDDYSILSGRYKMVLIKELYVLFLRCLF